MAHPNPQDRYWAQHTSPLPGWATRFRPHQWAAAREVVDAYKRGVRVVMLDAPTGAGKTLIAEMVRRMLAGEGIEGGDGRGVYVCSGKGLQDQFVADFPYADVLKGRGNYETVRGGKMVTAADCTSGKGKSCRYCPSKQTCPYQIAKTAALSGELAVLNTSYLLSEANGPGGFSREGQFVVVDECDELEGELMRYVEFNLSARLVSEVNKITRGVPLDPPGKGSHYKTIAGWLEDGGEFHETMDGAVEIARENGDEKAAKRYEGLLAQGLAVSEAIRENGEAWVRDDDTFTPGKRDGDAKALTMKPIVVDRDGERVLWRHARRWLLMSATVVSGAEMAGSLGLTEAGIGWEVVRVPMTFPLENRRVVVAPVADMSAKAWEIEKLAEGVRRVLEEHWGERVLVHTVSYKLQTELAERLTKKGGREIMTYKTAQEREMVLEKFKRTTNAVLLAPSMERGVDLKGDECRVVVVAKVPYGSLGDKQVSARMRRGREGGVWYAVGTIRKLVQMTGRGVRSETDWCKSYVLDSGFLRLWKNHQRLLPKWWVESLEWGADTRWLR